LRLPASVRVLTRCAAFGYYDHNYVVALQSLPRAPVRQRLWHIRAGEVVLATGAIERPLVFPNNDRPGVMLAGAAREYLRRYAVLPGRRVVIATNNDSAYKGALEFIAAGVEVAAILDARPASEAKDIAALRAQGVAIEWNSAPTNASGTELRRVEWYRIDAEG